VIETLGSVKFEENNCMRIFSGNPGYTPLYISRNDEPVVTWQYMDVPGEADEGHQEVSPVWPAEGAVKFDHVSLLYYPWLPPALNDVSFSIRACEHVSNLLHSGLRLLSMYYQVLGLTLLNSLF